MTTNVQTEEMSPANALAKPAPALGALTLTPLVELRTWLKASQDLLWTMSPTDPAYQAGLVIWEQRHDAYMARVRAEGEPE